MLSLPDSVQSSIVEEWVDSYGPGGYSGSMVALRLSGDVSDEDRMQALAIVDESLAPAPLQTVATEIARMRALTKARQSDSDGMIAVAMSEELAEYPADIVKDVCRVWSRSERFFPAWSELREMCEIRVRRRRFLQSALEQRERFDA